MQALNLLVRIFTAAWLLAGMSAASAQSPEKLAIRLDWTPWGVHAPFHLAQQKGWLRDAGLDAEIEDGNGSVTTVQIVGSGKFDAGHASLAPMMIARDKGLPIKAIANFARKNDIGLLVPKGSGMKTPKDLAGKKLLFTAGSLEAPFLDRFLAAGGLKREQVELLNVEASAKVGTYIAGRADGVFSTVPFVLPAVAASRASDAVLFSDYGLEFPSFGLFATEDKIRDRRAALSKLASIIAGAWQYIYDGHQDEAVQAIIAQRPQAKLDPKVLRAQIDSLQAFFVTPATANQPFGFMAESDWMAAVKTLTEGQLIKGNGRAADFYTNALLDATLIRKTSGK